MIHRLRQFHHRLIPLAAVVAVGGLLLSSQIAHRRQHALERAPIAEARHTLQRWHSSGASEKQLHVQLYRLREGDQGGLTPAKLLIQLHGVETTPASVLVGRNAEGEEHLIGLLNPSTRTLLDAPPDVESYPELAVVDRHLGGELIQAVQVTTSEEE
ncbi:MAG: hypothetical protein DWQ01_06435 [Planctomycetota bacterium]|nr:MAG: hypothetical protein DWQ01_06435 [Planctomycetota bacterium]